MGVSSMTCFILPLINCLEMLWSDSLVLGSGSGVGLIKSVLSASEVVMKSQTEAKQVLDQLKKTSASWMQV